MNNSILQEKIREFTSRGGVRNVVWKPDPGDYIIRMVPYKHNRDWPFTEMWFHYGISDKTLLSPHTFKRPDPVMDFAKSLLNTDDAEQKALGRLLIPKRRVYVPILVRGSEMEGVKFWGFGPKIYEQLVLLINDPDFGDISDPMNGHDIKVSIPVKKKNSFVAPTVMVRPKSSPITDDQKVLDLIGDMVDILKQWTEPTVEELKQILANFADQQDVNRDKLKSGKTVVDTNLVDSDDEFVEVSKSSKSDRVPYEPDDDENQTDAPSTTIVDVRESFKKYFKQ